MRPSHQYDTRFGRFRAGRQTVAGPPGRRSHDGAGSPLVSARVRLRWCGYLALTGTGMATGGVPAWALAGVALACLATPLALAANHGSAGLCELFLISRAPASRRPNTELKELA